MIVASCKESIKSAGIQAAGGHLRPKTRAAGRRGLGRVAGDDRSVDGADRDAGDPVGMKSGFGQRLVDACLIGAERAAALQKQGNAVERQTPFQSPNAWSKLDIQSPPLTYSGSKYPTDGKSNDLPQACWCPDAAENAKTQQKVFFMNATKDVAPAVIARTGTRKNAHCRRTPKTSCRAQTANAQSFARNQPGPQ